RVADDRVHVEARLLEPFTVERPPPANLAPNDDALFRHEYRRSFGGTDLYRLERVHVTERGTFLRGLREVPELRFLPGERLEPRARARAVLRRRRRFS